MQQRLGAGDDLSLGWAAFSRDLGVFVGAFFVGSLIMSASMFICAGPIVVGYSRMALKAARGERVEFNDLFSGFSQFGPAFVLGLLWIIALSVVSFIAGLIGGGMQLALFWLPVIPQLLAVPLGGVIGLLFAALTYRAPYYMADGDLDAMSCLQRAWTFGKANLGYTSVLQLLVQVVTWAGFAACGVGSLFATPLIWVMQGVSVARSEARPGVYEQPLLASPPYGQPPLYTPESQSVEPRDTW